MKSYEGIFVFPPTSTPDERKAQDKVIDTQIEKFKGKVVQRAEWGKRSLGYVVKRFREGLFVFVEFEMEPAGVIDFRKALEVNSDLLKYMVTVKDPKAGKVAPRKNAKKAAEEASPAVAAKS